LQEHIHVYAPPPGETAKKNGSSYVAPFHTDSGILLLITPAPELPLQVDTGVWISIRKTYFPPSLLKMMSFPSSFETQNASIGLFLVSIPFYLALFKSYRYSIKCVFNFHTFLTVLFYELFLKMAL
jgi:hypothetical protein